MNNFKEILIIDDEIDICRQLSGLLNDLGYNTTYSITSEKGLDLFKEKNFSLVLLDIWLNNSKFDGFQALDKIKNINPDIPVIMISGHGNIETAVNSIKKGAYDFVEKPFDSDILIFKIKKALETLFLKRKLNNFAQVRKNLSLVNVSKSSKDLSEFIDKNAKNDSNIFIHGDKGSGKQFSATIIHSKSYRSNKNFKIIDCNQKSHDFEVEFFGKEENKVVELPGILEDVNYGTLYLKNIDKIQDTTQGKLLRILEEKRYSRIGSFSPINLNLRIIASSTKNLMHFSKIIRKELLEKLNFAELRIPSLHERIEDFPGLVEIFVNQITRKTNLSHKKISDELLNILYENNFFTNVSQLEKFIEWLILMFDKRKEKLITHELLNDLFSSAIDLNFKKSNVSKDNDEMFNLKIKEARDNFEKKFLMYNLEKFKYKLSLVATKIGMERTALYRKVKSMKIDMDTK